jgi:hypothetical protein
MFCSRPKNAGKCRPSYQYVGAARKDKMAECKHYDHAFDIIKHGLRHDEITWRVQ